MSQDSSSEFPPNEFEPIIYEHNHDDVEAHAAINQFVDVQVHGFDQPGDPPPQENKRSARGRGRGARRGAKARGAGASSRDQIWEKGEPMVQVYPVDDDIPAHLRSMVRDLIHKRQHQERLRAANYVKRLQCRHAEYDSRRKQAAADDDVDEELLDINTTFDWAPMGNYIPQRETFTPTPGPVIKYNNMYDAFRSFWDDDILNQIVVETNRFATVIESPAFRKQWVDTNIHEVMTLFAFWMMLGILKMPTIKSCFSTNPLLSTEAFRRLFTSHRYESLCRALNFSSTYDDKPTSQETPLSCFGQILDRLNEKFQSSFVPGPNISIDESVLLWKGLLMFKKNFKTKDGAAKLGIKTYELCDSVTGYLWSFQVFTATSPGQLRSTEVVLNLIRPLLDKGYRVFMSDTFNSPALARYLKSRQTDCVGTLSPDRREVPLILSVADLQKEQLMARNSGDVCVMAFQDAKKVIAISTCHGTEVGTIISGRKNHKRLQYKPQAILDYNKYMGAIDRKDQMLEPYVMERKKGSKWHMKLFKRFLNCSILNSKILLESSQGKHEDHLACRLNLVQAITDKHLPFVPARRTHK